MKLNLCFISPVNLGYNGGGENALLDEIIAFHKLKFIDNILVLDTKFYPSPSLYDKEKVKILKQSINIHYFTLKTFYKSLLIPTSINDIKNILRNLTSI